MLKLLLAVDGSDPAIRATRKLIETADLFKDPVQVELVGVHLPIPKIGGLFNTVVNQQMVERYYRDEGAQMLAASEKLLSEAGVAHTSHILVGQIAETLVEHGDANGCRMIFMGTRGMSALSNMVMGSIATKAVHLAQVPVVLVR